MCVNCVYEVIGDPNQVMQNIVESSATFIEKGCSDHASIVSGGQLVEQ